MSHARFPDSWSTKALQALHKLTLTQEFLTSDDLHDALDEEPHNVNCWGAAMNEAQAIGLIIPTGRYVQSRRESAKHRTIKLFQSAYLRHPSVEHGDPIGAYLSGGTATSQESLL